MDLPLSLAVALLKDSEGVIEMDIPVTGNLGDPQFELGGAIRSAIGDAIGNVVSAPFRFLAGLVGAGEEDLQRIAYPAGRSDLTPPQRQREPGTLGSPHPSPKRSALPIRSSSPAGTGRRARTPPSAWTSRTAAALRAMEINADAILKATKVDGVYDRDPMLHPKAKKYLRLTYLDVLRKNLKVMDATAISLCMDNDLPIVVFNVTKRGNILKAVLGERIGTVVHGGK